MRPNEIPEFKRDFKKLKKRYRTLAEDFRRLCLALHVSAIPIDKTEPFATPPRHGRSGVFLANGTRAVLLDEWRPPPRHLKSLPCPRGRDHAVLQAPNKHTAILNDQGVCKIVKIRMACKVLRKSSLRVIYAYFEQEQRIDFIEIYFKGDKETEDRERIREYLKNQDSTPPTPPPAGGASAGLAARHKN